MIANFELARHDISTSAWSHASWPKIGALQAGAFGREHIYNGAGNSHGDTTSNFFTIGHSTRTIVEFAGLLRESAVDHIVDVRSMPRSRTNPQFNGETLSKTLSPWQIGYEHIAELGGHRGKSQNVDPSLNAYWRVRGFHNYADYALTAPFAAGLARLRVLGSRHRCAIMCAEAVWWRCHRRIIADYLLAAGESVAHILDASHVDEASLTPAAVPRSDGTLIYPRSSPNQSSML